MTQTLNKKKRSKRDLEKAQKLLQRMHDYIEVHGFNIDVAAEESVEWTDKLKREIRRGNINAVNVERVCFIGGARLAAGVDPDGYGEGTDSGDGPELTIGLEALDRVAEMSPEGKKAIENNCRGKQPGGIAEAFGNIFQRTLTKDLDWASTDYEERIKTLRKREAEHALGVIRQALTVVYNELEAR